MKIIPLYSRPQDDLDWENSLLEAENTNEPIYWQFKLGLEEGPIDFFDEAYLAALAIGMEEFKTKVFPRFSARTEGFILYHGSLDVRAKIGKNFLQCQEERGLDEQSLVSFLFPEYLHRILSFLPDETCAFAIFSGGKNWEAARLAMTILKDKFPYIIACLDEPCKAYPYFGPDCGYQEGEISSVALILPESFSEDGRRLFNFLYEALPSCRLIPESLLAESWDNLDEIYVIKSDLSKACQRLIMGFLSAGGAVLYASWEDGTIHLEK